METQFTANQIKNFFYRCDFLDRLVLRPLAHIRFNWELCYDYATHSYMIEDNSFAQILNELIEELSLVNPSLHYHDHEDRLAEYVRDKHKWPIYKKGGRWIGANYSSLLEQGGFSDNDQSNLVQAAAGRIIAALKHGQNHFDQMEDSHQLMLAAVLSIILYHRS